jgi:hypothetical protein
MRMIVNSITVGWNCWWIFEPFGLSAEEKNSRKIPDKKVIPGGDGRGTNPFRDSVGRLGGRGMLRRNRRSIPHSLLFSAERGLKSVESALAANRFSVFRQPRPEFFVHAQDGRRAQGGP